MQNMPELNFPAFDRAAKWLREDGWKIISPAEMDRDVGVDGKDESTFHTWESCLKRDLHVLTDPKTDAIILMAGWASSPGAREEARTAVTSGLKLFFYDDQSPFSEPRLLETTPDVIKMIMDPLNRSSSGETMVEGSTGGKKGQKRLRPDLIPPEALREVALCYGIGAEKYDPNNWKKGYPYSASLAALERHLLEWKLGNKDDPDGFKHLAAVVFHANTLIYRDELQPEWNDIHEAS